MFYVKMDLIFKFSDIKLVWVQVFLLPTLMVNKIEISAIFNQKLA